MFEAAFGHGTEIGMLATFAPSVPSMESEFNDMARARGLNTRIRTICVPDAVAALRGGDAARHNALLADAAPQLAQCDAVMLAQFSTSRAEKAVAPQLSIPVLTRPKAAVRKLRSALL